MIYDLPGARNRDAAALQPDSAETVPHVKSRKIAV